MSVNFFLLFFFFNDTATTEIYTLSLHDALPIFFHLDHRLLGVAPWAVGVLLRWQISLEDRLQHQHRCRHADPIPHGRDTQWPELAVGLRDVHASDRVRSVRLLPERKRQFPEPARLAIRLDIREVLSVHA